MASKAPTICDGTANAVDAKLSEIDRELSISVITEEDTEPVLDLLKRFFFKVGVHCVFRRRTRNSTKNIRAFARVAVTRVLVFLVL